jgi:hypothetical protein
VIISHKHRYLFVEFPHTASVAIRRELVDHYDGEPILAKHSTYRDFLATASEDERSYFVFSCIRNPLDVAVTKYFKLKTNHSYKSASAARKGGIGHVLHGRVGRFVRDEGADFDAFFLKVFRIQYNSWASLDHRRFDYVIRFEDLDRGFAEVLGRLGIEQVGPLPRTNSTGERKKEFLAYYDSPRVIERAKRVFAVYMDEWGYRFPAEWGDVRITRRQRLRFRLWNALLRPYWLYLKPWIWGAQMRQRRIPRLRALRSPST